MTNLITPQGFEPANLLNGDRVDARTLWEKLESRQEFAAWIKNRLADFTEGADYSSFDKIINRETGASRRKEYFLTINTAKHICLIERNEAGRRIRQYLIDVEKAYRDMNNDPAYQMATGLLAAQKLLEAKDARIAELEPKAAFYDQVADSRDAIEMRNVAAVLNIPGLGRNKLFALLRDKKIFDGNNIPYREYQERGYFRVIEKPWFDSRGESHIELVTLTLQKGLDYISRVAQGVTPFPGSEAAV
jgi:anti-repressor protein